jgi:chemotaxis family two-component system response regulator Rcp1
MKSLRVLLIEDNLADVELTREALDGAGLTYTMEVAADFEQAQEHVKRIAEGAASPDILLMDLNLPKGSGFELLKLIRQHPECQRVPVIIVSSSNASRDRAQAAELGAMHYFRKPSDLDEFMKLGPLVMRSVGR